MSAKPWNELTKEDIGLRPIREGELMTTEIRDWRGIAIPGKVGPAKRRTCTESIDGGRATYKCSKDAQWVRDEGAWNTGRPDYLCPSHAAGALRSAKSSARKAEESAQKASAQDVAEKRLAAIADALGLTDFELHYGWSRGEYSTTHAVVSIDELERLKEASA